MAHSRNLRTEFGKHSALYDEVRPTYPPELVDDVILFSRIPAEGSVLDIGCGPGRATILFGERGYNVLGVDLSPELIAIAQRNSSHRPNVQYIVGEFEDIELPISPFDLIISAQALHWIDPERGYKKIASTLKDSGTLAAFWNFEDYARDSVAVPVRELYRRHCPAFPHDLGSPTRYVEKLDTSALFKPIEIKEYRWDLAITRDDYIKLARTWAWVSSLPENKLERLSIYFEQLLKCEPEQLSIPYKTVLLTTNKKKN